MRRGFGLITAIIVLVTVATLMTLMISISTSTAKQTTDIYLKEQAELLMRSSVEYAMLAISAHDNSASCVQSINIDYPKASSNATHHSTVTISYLGSSLPAGCPTLSGVISTLESNLTAMIDVVVEVNQTNTGITEPIRLHRRTLQKP
jgi:hypothetical protein